MQHQGWIKLHRQILESDIWDDEEHEPFDRRSAWIDLLLIANHKDKQTVFDGKPITVKRGQKITSVRKLSERWRWSVNRTYRYLKLLEELGMIERQSDNRRTLLTIVNYEVFQGCENTDEYSNEYSDRTLTNTVIEHSRNTNKNIKNDKNEKKYIKMFVPPTLEEVKTYCQERNNNIDAQTFIDFYSSKGWMIGKNKMKDWKASVRTWERHDNGSKVKTPQYKKFSHTDELSELEKQLLAN